MKYVLSLSFMVSLRMMLAACQDYSCDSLAVRAILDSNGLTQVTVEEVTGVTNGRIDSLKLHGLSFYPGNIPSKIHTLPDAIGNLSRLTWLHLENNTIGSIPDTIGNLRHLVYLDLWDNDITVIPDAIGNLQNLEVLDISFNYISIIPDTIGSLTSLQELKLSGNRITSIPAAIGNLSNLWHLRLSENQITRLPDEIGALVKLTNLIVDGNQLNEIADAIGNLTNLLQLSLKDNDIEEIPDAVGKLDKLVRLYLGNNRISMISDSVINLTRLGNLDLSNNRIGSLSPAVAAWANTYDPDWQETQDPVSAVAYPDRVTGHGIQTVSLIQHYAGTNSRISTIEYRLPVSGTVELSVCGPSGKYVDRLVHSFKPSGIHLVRWNTGNLKPGIYYFSIQVTPPGENKVQSTFIVRKGLILN